MQEAFVSRDDPQQKFTLPLYFKYSLDLIYESPLILVTWILETPNAASIVGSALKPV